MQEVSWTVKFVIMNSKESKKYGTYLSLVIHKASIYSFKVQILCNIGVDEHTNQSSIGHHKLP